MGLHAHLHRSGRAMYGSVADGEALEAAINLTRTEGIIPALESAHALAFLPRLGAKPDHLAVVNLSGRGDKDLAAFLEYHRKKTGAVDGG